MGRPRERLGTIAMAARKLTTFAHLLADLRTQRWRQNADGWKQDPLFELEVRPELRGKDFDEPGHALADPWKLRRLVLDLGAQVNHRVDQVLVIAVFQCNALDRCDDVPISPEQTRRDRLVLVRHVQRQRFDEVPPDLRRGVADLLRRAFGAEHHEPPGEHDVLPDPTMASAQEIDEVVGLIASSEGHEHAARSCSLRTGTICARYPAMLSIETPVAQLVLDHSECASIFDRYRIDYCCKGSRPLRVACEERGLDPVQVLEDCELAMRRRQPNEVDPRTLSTKDLITKVIARHHQYLHRSLPFLQGLSKKVARVHGDREPSLRDLDRVFDTLATVLSAHLDDEEHNLFPTLIAREHPTEQAAALLRAMREEHEEVGMMLSVLRAIANDYAPPDWACNSYRTLLSELAQLEADTLRHVHIENHVLLPRYVASA